MPDIIARGGTRSELRTNRKPVNSHRDSFARDFYYTNIENIEHRNKLRTGKLRGDGGGQDGTTLRRKERKLKGKWSNGYDEPSHDYHTIKSI